MKTYTIVAGGNRQYGRATAPHVGFKVLYDTVKEHAGLLAQQEETEYLAAKWEMFAADLLDMSQRTWLPNDRFVYVEGPDLHLWGVVPDEPTDT